MNHPILELNDTRAKSAVQGPNSTVFIASHQSRNQLLLASEMVILVYRSRFAVQEYGRKLRADDPIRTKMMRGVPLVLEH